MSAGNGKQVLFALLVTIGSSLGLAGCSAADSDPDSEELTEDANVRSEGVTGSFPVGTELVASANVNLRSGPSTDASILRVVPSGSKVTVEATSPSGDFYKVKHNGVVGWSSGKYYTMSGGPAGSVPVGTELTATGNVNLRSGPSTDDAILTVVPQGGKVTVEQAAPENGYFKVNYNDTVGWSSGKYYGQGGDVGGGGSTLQEAAITRGKSVVGFSYWWGHGRWLDSGPTAGNKGSCSGSCPNCSHSGSYGADCSGFVAKAWEAPASNDDITVDSHPYSTASFNDDTGLWKTVSRDSMQKADALVYRSGGAGHIMLYRDGDGWGSLYALECKGCAAGCVAGYRTVGSSYHAIRRTGF
jgi:uncharacterized protein YraI